VTVEILKSIKQAEDEADMVRRQSLADARQILSDAKAEAQKLAEQLLKAAEAEAAAIISQARTAASGEADRMDRAASAESEGIMVQAGSEMDKAVEAIVGRIISSYGNS
jgi:V/A-type H+-transporting ATPase subunit G/H